METNSTSSAHETILGRARDVAEQIAGPKAEQVDREARWPEESMRALQEAGLGGLVVPAEHGGLDRGLRTMVEVCEILGKACGSTGLCFGMHCVATACLASRPTDRQIEKFLEPIAAGEHLTTLALSEPGTGAHFYLPEAELLVDDGHLRLRGTKSFITSGGHADSYVVSTAAASDGAAPGEFSVVAVPNDAEGVSWGDPWRGLGMRGNASRTMTLEDVELHADNLLGTRGDQIWYVFNVVTPYFVCAMSGTYLGLADAALEEAVEHLRTRDYSFGKRAPGQHDTIQRDLGKIWRRVEATRRLLYHAADAADVGDDESRLAIFAAKADVAECAVEIVNRAMTLVGGRGYAENAKLGRLLRDVRAADVMAPTTQLLEIWTGRSLLDVPLLTE